MYTLNFLSTKFCQKSNNESPLSLNFRRHKNVTFIFPSFSSFSRILTDAVKAYDQVIFYNFNLQI